MAAKTNTDVRQIDKSAFFWVGRCGICHPGGGPGEFDRFGQKYYDPRSKQWGFEALGLTAKDVGLDGDYAFVAGSGVARPKGHPTPQAAWDKTLTSEPDCLMCHASKRTLDGPKNMNWIWRTATLRAMAGLEDSAGRAVPAFMAAAAAGHGWFSGLRLAPAKPGVPPTATELDLSYRKGIDEGELVADAGGVVSLVGAMIVTKPRDAACWGCHATPDLKKRARTWFDPARDVHYRRWSLRHDGDPANDLPSETSQTCVICHRAGYEHQIGKGDPFEGTVAADRKFVDFLSCRECHAADNAYQAPVPASEIHRRGHLERIACQLCHIPYKDKTAQYVVDNAATGASTSYDTDRFLSADPVDPRNADRSRWYPSYHVKVDADGKKRIFPAKLLNVVWWGAWYQGADGKPNTADDFVRPVVLWRIRAVTGGEPLPGASDDNGDGKVEINRPEEIRLYVAALRAALGTSEDGKDDPDDYVLVKGGKIWWLDGDGKTGTVETFDLHADHGGGTDATPWEGAGLESAVPFSMDHNVLPKAQALSDCKSCHVAPSPHLLGRKVLLDPFGPDDRATPVYEDSGAVLARSGFRFFGEK